MHQARQMDGKWKRAYRVVFEALAHLLAISCQHQTIADQVLEGGLVKQQRGEHDEGVEPAARLVQACTHHAAIDNRCC